ncbi:MAG: hypothetical protein WB764_24305 [Xanthobacteraceae bacterium]
MRWARTGKFVPPWQWGIFRWKSCTGLHHDTSVPENASITAIYEALKGSGFKETYWQFIYPGQIGGLIQNAGGTLIEIHVRFFKNGLIYAEMEIGRTASLHLIDRRLYANHYLVRKMSSNLTKTDLDYLRNATEKSKLMYPRKWSEWSPRNRFMTPSLKRKIRLLAILGDWRTLALVMMASIVSSIADRSVVIPLLTALMIFVYVLAPKRTQ